MQETDATTMTSRRGSSAGGAAGPRRALSSLIELSFSLSRGCAVPAGEQRRGGRVAQAVDLVVDRAVLLDVEVLRRHVGLRLVVVVVGDEVLDRVLGEELPELVAELRRQGLVVGDDQRGPLDLLD